MIELYILIYKVENATFEPIYTNILVKLQV